MRVKIFKNNDESSNDELKWLLRECCLETWSQFERLLNKYQQEPDIIVKRQPTKLLENVIETFESIESYLPQIISIKAQLASMYDSAQHWPNFEEDFYQQPQEEQIIEALEEEDSYEDEICEEEYLLPDEQPQIESEIVLESYEPCFDDQDDIFEYDDPLKCENCFITFKSETGLQAHQKTCNTPITNVNINTRKPKLPDEVELPKNNVVICEQCGKVCRTAKSLKEHMKTHSEAFRKKCPHCNVCVFSSVLQRHIQAVHKKLKPHKW